MMVSSICASAKPMQLRAPPPKGTHAWSVSLRCVSSRSAKRSGSGPDVGVATGQVGGPQDQGPGSDLVAAEVDVGCGFPGSDHAGRVEPQGFSHDSAGEVQPVQQLVVRAGHDIAAIAASVSATIIGIHLFSRRRAKPGVTAFRRR